MKNRTWRTSWKTLFSAVNNDIRRHKIQRTAKYGLGRAPPLPPNTAEAIVLMYTCARTNSRRHRFSFFFFFYLLVLYPFFFVFFFFATTVFAIYDERAPANKLLLREALRALDQPVLDPRTSAGEPAKDVAAAVSWKRKWRKKKRRSRKKSRKI